MVWTDSNSHHNTISNKIIKYTSTIKIIFRKDIVDWKASRDNVEYIQLGPIILLGATDLLTLWLQKQNTLLSKGQIISYPDDPLSPLQKSTQNIKSTSPDQHPINNGNWRTGVVLTVSAVSSP